LETIHVDACGPMRTTCLNCERYFLLFVDAFTRMTWLFLLKKKSETFSFFQVFKELTKNEIDMNIKCLRSNNGGEFVSNKFNNYCDENGIKRHFSVTETPQQNGVVERKNITVMEMARTMLNEFRLNDMI
jgi:transposase InsO family protein